MKAMSDGSSCPMTIRNLSCTGFRNGSACRLVHPFLGRDWFWSVLQQKQRIQPLDGLGYRPIARSSEAKRSFWEWIGRP